MNVNDDDDFQNKRSSFETYYRVSNHVVRFLLLYYLLVLNHNIIEYLSCFARLLRCLQAVVESGLGLMLLRVVKLLERANVLLGRCLHRRGSAIAIG